MASEIQVTLLVEMQLVLRAGFQRHETVRERRLAAFAPAGLIQGRELILDGEAGPRGPFFPPGPGPPPRRPGPARRGLSAHGHKPLAAPPGARAGPRPNRPRARGDGWW